MVMRYKNLFYFNLKWSICLWVLTFSTGSALQLSAQCEVYFSYCPDRGVTVVDCDNSGSEPINWPMPIAATLGGCTDFVMNQTGGPLLGSLVGGPASYLITYTAYATDIVSRERKVSATCSFSVTVLPDNAPPVFDNCPPNITIYTGSATTANATWTEPTVSDNCGRVIRTKPNIPCNTPLGPGVYWVTYSAVDQSGNYAYCTFSITVIPGFVQPGSDSMFPEDKSTERNNTVDNPASNDVMLLPNPFRDGLSLNSANAWDTDLNVELFDIQGQLMLTQNWPAQTNQTVLNTGNLIPGIYLVKIVSSDGAFRTVLRGVKL